jgi:hypothetical protein
VIATLFRFEPKSLLKFTESETRDVNVKALFST